MYIHTHSISHTVWNKNKKLESVQTIFGKDLRDGKNIRKFMNCIIIYVTLREKKIKDSHILQVLIEKRINKKNIREIVQKCQWSARREKTGTFDLGYLSDFFSRKLVPITKPIYLLGKHICWILDGFFPVFPSHLSPHPNLNQTHLDFIIEFTNNLGFHT